MVQAEPATIPQPKPDPIRKNLNVMDQKEPVQGLMRLARTYGPIFRLSFPGDRSILVVSSQALVDELSNEQRFDKKLGPGLEMLRDLVGDGLFTAHTQEPNWAKAHRILMPAFGPASIRDMFDPMLDIADQLLLRWERFGPAAVINVPDQMTRLTLDTVALCAFDYRFNSFYQNEMHPFVNAMVNVLAEAGARSRRLPLQNQLKLLARRQYEEDIHFLHETADDLVAQRRRDPDAASKKDLLNLMLQGRDPVTGEGLSDENIRYQMVTFLIAGHETTSGLLSFALYELLKNPAALNRARALVDEVLGTEMPRFEQLPKLTYIDQVLKETLRLWPTAPAFNLYPYQDVLLAGRYPVAKDESILVLTPMLHRDPRVWGEDVERFDPERFAPEAAARLPANAWKPFGNGQRACIGRPFAMQEATLVLAMILQRFDLIEQDPAYRLQVKETLTLKPYNFFIRARRRDGAAGFQPRRAAAVAAARPLTPQAPAAATATGTLTPLLVLFGSNSGSAQAFAQRIASDSKTQGYAAEIGPLDESAGHLPTEGGVVIVAASYEGQPTDDARQFVAWLDTLGPGSLPGVKYAVFGCGNRDWQRTYQAIPRRIDEKLAGAGAARLLARGEADAGGDFFGDFDAWYASFWSALAGTFGHEAKAPAAAGRAFEVEVIASTRSAILRQADLQYGEIVENRELVDMSAPEARSKRHLEIALPEGMTYEVGDYLAVLPTNPRPAVERALRYFDFAPDNLIVIHKPDDGQTALPVEYPISVNEILSSYVELGQPATRKQIEALRDAAQAPAEQAALAGLATDAMYRPEVLQKQVSVLDLLERFPSCRPSFGEFLQMLPPMRARQYSISSSPLWREDHCTLTVAVLRAPAASGQGTYLGVASNYLAAANPGDRVAVCVRPSNAAFRPPQAQTTPIIMVCAGSGLAPFRGFLQERAIQAAGGQQPGPALLFFGCDRRDVDLLYHDELAAWEQAGVVEVRPAFSAAPEGGVTFVQDRLWADRADVVALVRQGAYLFVCGDGKKMAPAVHDTCVRIYQEAAHATRADAEIWMAEVERRHSRYVADIFA